MIYYDRNTASIPLYKEEVQRLLRGNVCAVIFTKTNGEERLMHCTLIPSRVPPTTHDDDVARPFNPSFVAVWDLDKAAWRSFKLASVRKISVLTFV